MRYSSRGEARRRRKDVLDAMPAAAAPILSAMIFLEIAHFVDYLMARARRASFISRIRAIATDKV